MKFIFCLLVFLFVFSYAGQTFAKERYVIGGYWAGLFSNVFAVINHLIWCQKTNKDLVVHWYKNPAYYAIFSGYNGSKNIWEYYFYPVSKVMYEKGDEVHHDYIPPNRESINMNYQQYQQNFSYEYRSFIHSYIEKYIHIKKNILIKIEDFYKTTIEGKKTVGIHVRRTDHNEAPRVPLEKFIETANQFKNVQFFIATDDQNALNILKATLNGPVIYYDSYRSSSDQALHVWNPSVKNRALMGEQVLIEAKLLSMCDYFIHAVSNVSLAALFFNPLLKNIYLEA